MEVKQAEAPAAKKCREKSVAWYTPRPWHGMTFGVWTRMLADNHFDVSLSRTPMAVAITCVSAFNSYSRWLSEHTYARRAEQVEIEHDPVFVIGHWRTGTTLLHELLIRDPQFTYPSTFQCMVPHHFLRTHRILPHVSKVLLPKRRVMDNMEFGWEHPQEDEFALCNLGVPSPYLYWAFPRSRERYDKFLTLDAVTPEERAAWKSGFLWFIKRLTLQDPRQLVLKSPPHTARLKLLLELFPNAKFVHLTRDPRTVVPSTERTWERMRHACGLEFRGPDDLEPYVLDTFERMYAAYWRDRNDLSSEQLIELRYDDLVQDPMAHLERLYTQLGLKNFQHAQGKMKRYLRQVTGYKTNRFDLSAEKESRITERCERYMEEYRYLSTSGTTRLAEPRRSPND